MDRLCVQAHTSRGVGGGYQFFFNVNILVVFIKYRLCSVYLGFAVLLCSICFEIVWSPIFTIDVESTNMTEEVELRGSYVEPEAKRTLGSGRSYNLTAGDVTDKPDRWTAFKRYM